MSIRLNPEVSALIKQQFGKADGGKILAQVFEQGAIIHRQDEQLVVHVGLFNIGLEVQQSDRRWRAINPESWSPPPDLPDARESDILHPTIYLARLAAAFPQSFFALNP